MKELTVYYRSEPYTFLYHEDISAQNFRNEIKKLLNINDRIHVRYYTFKKNIVTYITPDPKNFKDGATLMVEIDMSQDIIHYQTRLIGHLIVAIIVLVLSFVLFLLFFK